MRYIVFSISFLTGVSDIIHINTKTGRHTGGRRPMGSHKIPVFRSIIVPWYDTEAACLLVIAAMLSALLFGVAGISVVREDTDHLSHLWIVVSIIVPSTGVIVSTTIRLVRRYLNRLKLLAVTNGRPSPSRSSPL